MIMTRTCLFLLAGVLLTGTLSAGAVYGAESKPDAAVLTTAAVEERKICKRFTPTGSRIPKRICLPERQWAAMREGGQRAARDAIRDDSQVRYKPAG